MALLGDLPLCLLWCLRRVQPSFRPIAFPQYWPRFICIEPICKTNFSSVLHVFTRYVCVRVCVLQRYRAAFGCVLRHCWFDPFFVGCTLLDGTDLVSVSGIRICCHSTVQAVTCRHVMDIYQTADKVFF